MKRIRIAAVVLFVIGLGLTASETQADVFLEDGGFHIIDGPSEPVVVDLSGSSSSPTTVEIRTGADIDGNPVFDTSLETYLSSTATMNGGRLQQDAVTFDDSTFIFNGGIIDDDIDAFDDSIVRMNGGTVADSFFTNDFAQAFITGGTIENDLIAFGLSDVNITGGTFKDEVTFFDGSTGSINGGILENDLNVGGFSQVTVNSSVGDDVEAKDFGFVQIFGGTYFEDIEASDESRIEIYGGSIGVGGTFDTGISATGSGGGFGGGSLISLFGPEFFVDGVPTFGPLIFTSGTLSGTLSDGSTFSMPFEADGGVILLNFRPVPEPTSATLLFLGLMTGALRRRRRQ